MVHWIIGKLSAKNQGPNLKVEKVMSLLSSFRDRQAEIAAYRSNVCNQKGSPRVNWTIGRWHAKNQGHISRDKKIISKDRHCGL